MNGPSEEVMTRLPEPEVATATNRPPAYTTLFQLLSIFVVDATTQVEPSRDVMTRLAVPESATATNLPLP